jgi:iron complex transport system substrate-binding protein
VLHELPGAIRDLGTVLNVRGKAEELAHSIESSLNDIALSGKTKAGSVKKKVLFIVWPEPLLVAGPGTAIDDAFTLLGLENTAMASKTAYPRYSIEEVIHQAPDVIFVGKGSGMDMRIVTEGILKKLSNVPAVKNDAVCYVGDGLYRLGPRIVQGVRELSACMQ